MLLKMSEEPDDYEGPWPEGDAMTEWVMVPVEPTEAMFSASRSQEWDTFEQEWRAMLDAAPAAPVQPVQAQPEAQGEPVAQIGWADEFGNLFPMGAWKPAQRTHHDLHKAEWRPVFLHPPRADAEMERLRDALENVRTLAARHRTEKWAGHMLRFCESAGVIGSPLRGA